MIRGWLVIFLFPVFSMAKPLEQPPHCLKKEKFPCALLVFEKTHFPTAGVQIFVSADTLFEMETDSIYLIRGKLWVVSDRTYTVRSRYGIAKSEGQGELWAEASESEFTVRAFSNSLAVLPRGGSSAKLDAGFEMRLSYVDRETRAADIAGPLLMNLHSQIKDLHSVVESEDLFREKTAKLTSIVLAAAPVAAENTKLAIERQFASVRDEEDRLKYEKVKSAGRDSYLRKLFIKKSNFED